MFSFFSDLDALFYRLVGKRIPKELLAVIIFASLIYSLASWQDEQNQNVMKGEWNIAISTFSSRSAKDISTQNAYLIGLQFYNRLNQELLSQGAAIDLSIEIWGPDKTPPIRGNTINERATNAQAVASRINADVIIYGVVEKDGSVLFLQPEFYVAIKNYYEVYEIVGQYTLGPAIPIVGQSEEIPSQIRINRELAARSKAFSLVANGLSLFSFHDYYGAYQKFSEANSVEFWRENVGRETIFLFLGNAAGRANKLPEAESSFLKALEIDPEYSRALIGLAGIKYVMALEGSSSDNFHPDQGILEESIQLYQAALSAKNKPGTADIEAKVAFGLGQVYLVKWLEGNGSPNLALNNFNYVIKKYKDESNFRISELAAESYARIGLIRRELHDFESAIIDFENAVDISTSPFRKGLYWETLGDLFLEIGKPQDSDNAYFESITHYLLAISLTDSPLPKARLLGNLSNLYRKVSNFPEATDSLIRAIELSEGDLSQEVYKATLENLIESSISIETPEP